MTQAQRRTFLIEQLLRERPQARDVSIPDDANMQAQMLRALLNTRMPGKIDTEFLDVQDAYLQEETAKKGFTDSADLPRIEDGIVLWQGDITTLRCDAIVNAANSGLTGCYIPCHRCIDNCIHTFAGVQLRLECARIIEAQGHEEKTGGAKITRAYNLPCRYVLHTVGPIVVDRVTRKEREQLASCYRACLELAAAHRLHSVAFCCISTGEFHFPNELAAEIAVRTVRETRERIMRDMNRNIEVIFNVFKDVDFRIYRRILGERAGG